MTEFEFDDKTIQMMQETEQLCKLFSRAMPIFDKLSDKELDLLDRLLGIKKTGVITNNDKF